ncbi:carbohydrate-binding domain-containing protein [Planococcus maritimus]|uniref:Carbohydrate-binding domain-containing protein n=1 Tax=Planococcus maritimus TaxID=192421 RepID=A0A7D7MAG4_PLAMR|nr:carbohydrate-binding domain-containing protein [Planococcus maritimus]QMT16835.1 carbohydrate-binding domain-containing protein [Planococcus maritimus]
MIHKNMFKMASVALSASLLFACSNTDLEETAEASSPAQEIVQSEIDSVLTYTAGDEYEELENAETIELTGTEADYASSAAVLFEEGTLTIKAGGTYVLSGSLDGQVVVDSEDDNPVRIVLDGVSIQSSETSAIFVEKAEKTIISLEEGSENRVADAANYSDTDDADEPNAAIFSKSDLTINGTGQLVVEGNYNNGITSKDALKITGGDVTIFAVDDALMGRDLVAAKDGTLTIEAGDDGIKTTNDEENTGTIALEGGTYSIVAGGDGIQSSADAYITSGAYSITSGGGSPETVKTNSPGPAQGTATEEADVESGKGLKTEGALFVTGGSFTVDSADDAVHSNGDVAISGGEWTLSTGEDGIHADQMMVLDDGTFDIAKSYEALEAAQLSINGGEYTLWASDDGINVSNGTATTDEDTTTSTQEEPLLTITGGFMSVDAGGDGLDANGSIHMTGGTVLVNGPVTDMEGSIDYDNTFTQEGGLLIAAGSSGMVQSTSEDSTQSAVVMTFPDIQEAGTLTHLEDSAGNTVASFAPEKDYQAIYISSPDLQVGSSYTLSVGGSSSGEETEGLYTGGSYEGGTEVLSFVQEEIATWLNEDGITEAAPEHGGGGGAGGPGGDGQSGPPQGANLMEQLDEETALQVEEIRAQLEAGTLTEEQAQTALAELGIELPMRPMDDTVPAQ